MGSAGCQVQVDDNEVLCCSWSAVGLGVSALTTTVRHSATLTVLTASLTALTECTFQGSVLK